MAESVSWRRSCVKSESKSIDDFSRNATRLQRLVYKDTEEFRSELCSILKEINAIDYSACHQSEEVSPFVKQFFLLIFVVMERLPADNY